MRRAAKIIFLLFVLLISVAVLALARLFILPGCRNRYVSRFSHASGELIRKALGIKITLKGYALQKRSGPGIFFVCNHLSYLDGIIINSLFPVLFVGRGDLKDWPLLGIFTRLSGTIFVNRASASRIHDDIKRIESALRSGVNVMLFPEGTTTDGNKVLPFKSSLLQAPVTCQSEIVPLSISYLSVDGEAVSEENKDILYWYSETGFLPHFLRVLAVGAITVEVKISEPLSLQGHDRKSLSVILKKTIEDNLRLFPLRAPSGEGVAGCEGSLS